MPGSKYDKKAGREGKKQEEGGRNLSPPEDEATGHAGRVHERYHKWPIQARKAERGEWGHGSKCEPQKRNISTTPINWPCGCLTPVRNNMSSLRNKGKEEGLRVGFWNVRRTGSVMDVGLQRAAELDIDIFFMAEVHLDKDRDGILQVKRHAGYERVSTLTEGTKVVAYGASELMGSIAVLWEDNNIVVVKVGDLRVGGVYWQPEWKSEETEEKLAKLGRKLEGKKRVVIGDWNAHHEEWACEGSQGNARGNQLVEWMETEDLYLGSTKGEATRQQGGSKSVIDFTLVCDLEEWEEGRSKEGEEKEEEWGMSDHRLI